MKLNLYFLRHRLLVVYVWTSVLYIGYQITNHFHWITPHYLPLTTLDQALPFLVWTVIPYLVLILGMYLFAFIDNRDDFFQALVALTVTVIINYSIYTLYPTVYYRPPMPTEDGFSFALYRWLVSIDSPANCLPSGHIATSALGCWYLARHHKKLRWPLLVIFSALGFTTLTTKQHYLIDIPAGIITAVIGVMIASRIARANSRFLFKLYPYWKAPN